MKQGSGNNTMGGRKIEPMSHAISPAGVSQIGETVDKRAIENFNKGRGYKAPMSGQQNHPSGSQGRYDND